MQLEEQHPLFPLTLTLPAKYKESCCRYLREYASAENSKTWAAMYLALALEKAEGETLVVHNEEQGSTVMAALLLTQHEQDPDAPDSVPAGLNPYPLLADMLHAAVCTGWQEPTRNLRRVHLLAAQRLMRQHLYHLPRWERRLTHYVVEVLADMLRDSDCTFVLENYLPMEQLAVFFAVYTAEHGDALTAEEVLYLGELTRTKLILDKAYVGVHALRDYHAQRARLLRRDSPEACLDAVGCRQRAGHKGACVCVDDVYPPGGDFFPFGPLSKEDMAVVLDRLRREHSETGNLSLTALTQSLLATMCLPYARPVLIKPTERNLLLAAIPVDRGALREGLSDTLYAALNQLAYGSRVTTGVPPSRRVRGRDTKHHQAVKVAAVWNATHPVGTHINWKSSDPDAPLQCSANTTGPAFVRQEEAVVPVGLNSVFPLREVTVPSPTEPEEEDMPVDEEVIQSYLESKKGE